MGRGLLRLWPQLLRSRLSRSRGMVPQVPTSIAMSSVRWTRSRVSALRARRHASAMSPLSPTTRYGIVSGPRPPMSGLHPSFAWYVSDTGGPWQLIEVVAFSSAAQDVGERPGTRGGYPNNISSPNIQKNEDFYSYITRSEAVPAFTSTTPCRALFKERRSGTMTRLPCKMLLMPQPRKMARTSVFLPGPTTSCDPSFTPTQVM